MINSNMLNIKIFLLAGVKDFSTVGAGVLPSQFMHQLHVCPQTHLKKKRFFPTICKVGFPSKYHLVSKLLAADLAG